MLSTCWRLVWSNLLLAQPDPTSTIIYSSAWPYRFEFSARYFLFPYLGCIWAFLGTYKIEATIFRHIHLLPRALSRPCCQFSSKFWKKISANWFPTFSKSWPYYFKFKTDAHQLTPTCIHNSYYLFCGRLLEMSRLVFLLITVRFRFNAQF